MSGEQFGSWAGQVTVRVTAPSISKVANAAFVKYSAEWALSSIAFQRPAGSAGATLAA